MFRTDDDRGDQGSVWYRGQNRTQLCPRICRVANLAALRVHTDLVPHRPLTGRSLTCFDQSSKPLLGTASGGDPGPQVEVDDVSAGLHVGGQRLAR